MDIGEVRTTLVRAKVRTRVRTRVRVKVDEHVHAHRGERLDALAAQPGEPRTHELGRLVRFRVRVGVGVRVRVRVGVRVRVRVYSELGL